MEVVSMSTRTNTQNRLAKQKLHGGSRIKFNQRTAPNHVSVVAPKYVGE